MIFKTSYDFPTVTSDRWYSSVLIDGILGNSLWKAVHCAISIVRTISQKHLNQI